MHVSLQWVSVLCDPMNCRLPWTPHPRGSPGKTTGVDWHALLQVIFTPQGLDPHLLFPVLAGGFFYHWAT